MTRLCRSFFCRQDDFEAASQWKLQGQWELCAWSWILSVVLGALKRKPPLDDNASMLAAQIQIPWQKRIAVQPEPRRGGGALWEGARRATGASGVPG